MTDKHNSPGQTEQIHLTINGKAYDLQIRQGQKLVDLLRNTLHLTGTKVGCGEGRCGACTVLVNGKSTKSCIYPAAKAHGKQILTIEGLAEIVNNAIQLHPLQEAFITYGAVQCGFCTPGQILSAYALLSKNSQPKPVEIRQALDDNLCRCGGYHAIEQAVLAAAESIRNGQPIQAPTPPLVDSIHKVIGQPVPRPDALEKVTGAAVFTDDLVFEGMLHAKVLRAKTPHALLRKLDVSEAQKMPGVVAVLTAGDIPGKRSHGLVIPDWPILVGIDEQVRYVGDAVAIIAAETQAIAEQAMDLVEVIYESLPVVSSPVHSLQDNAPLLHKDGNLLKHIKVRKGQIEQGFADADLILEHTFHTPPTDHLFMEPECSIARPTADGRMEIYVGSQIPYADRQQVADALGWEAERVRVIGQLVGGGFGGKEDIMGQIHAALLANATHRPVKLLFDRRESLLVHPKRHATQIRVKIGAKANGQLTAVETELFGDTGAYASLGEKVLTRATTHSAGPYQIPHTKADCYAMYTNNPPAGAFRGFGVLQSAFAIESMMDMLAEKLGLDPFYLRQINALKTGSTTNTGQLLTESVGLLECLERVQNKLYAIDGPEPFKPVHYERDSQNFVSAWGIAAAFKNTGLGSGAEDKSGAEVELYEDGTLQVRSAAAELGQGLVTVMQMIVAEELQVRPTQVRVLVMDTDLTPDGGPTTASRQTYVTGNATRNAALALKQAISQFLADAHQANPNEIKFGGGKVYTAQGQWPLAEVARQMRAASRVPCARYDYIAPATKALGENGPIHFAFSFAAQAAQVEVNLDNGEVRVLHIISANDVGKAINPLGLQGQVEGGVVMGLGHALMEEFVVREGKVISDRMAKYQIPHIQDTPPIETIFVEAPTAEGPYGAKGVGEIVSIPTPPAITNAIYNAVGVRIDHLPVKKEYLLQMIRQSKN